MVVHVPGEGGAVVLGLLHLGRLVVRLLAVLFLEALLVVDVHVGVPPLHQADDGLGHPQGRVAEGHQDQSLQRGRGLFSK